MRILLDECVDQRLRLLFTEHDCQTAGYANLSGLKNGTLLTAAEAAGFEVLITTDQEIPHQQNLTTRRISIVILCAATNRLADLTLLMPAALRALDALAPGAGRPNRLVRRCSRASAHHHAFRTAASNCSWRALTQGA